MKRPPKKSRFPMVTSLMETFGLSLSVAFVVATIIMAMGVAAVWWIFRSAPPRTLVLTSGPAGSSFQRAAEKYQKALAEHGVRLEIESSQGSMENLQRLQSKSSKVDIGFVQGGLVDGPAPENVMSLGSVSYQPLTIFYKSDAAIARLADFAGKRLAIGAPGSGTRALSLALLHANGIDPGGSTTLLDLDAEAAANALLEGKIDATFLMGDSAPLATMRTLLRADGIRLYSFTQAEAYVRRFSYLNRLVLPQGSIDLGRNLPAQDIVLVGPTVELLARKGLHPALSDLLLGIAKEVHGQASILQKRGEFPAPLEHEFKLSDDALRYYKSGKSYLYNWVKSFWLASLLDRVLVVFVPALLIMIPTVRLLPLVYRMTNQMKIYRCYRPLLRMEREAGAPLTPDERDELLSRLDEIEASVNRLKVPASFADQFYDLRGHIAFVRRRLEARTA